MTEDEDIIRERQENKAKTETSACTQKCEEREREEHRLNKTPIDLRQYANKAVLGLMAQWSAQRKAASFDLIVVSLNKG